VVWVLQKESVSIYQINSLSNIGGKEMKKFVWTEKENIRPKGEWLKVLREEDGKLLCERADYFYPNVWIDKEDVLDETDEHVF
jgi:hypothetical protein